MGVSRSGLRAPTNSLLGFNFKEIKSRFFRFHCKNVYPPFYSEPLLKADYIGTILRLDKRMMMMVVMVVR